MNSSTVKLVVTEMFAGPDSPGIENIYEKIASRLTSYSTEGLIRQLFEFKRRKKYLLQLEDKEEFERRLVIRELSSRNLKDINVNEFT